MSSSSKKSAAKVNLLGKRKQQDDLATKTILKKHKETSEEKAVNVIKRMLFVSGLSRQTKASDIIHFFNDGGEVVLVRLILNQEGRHVGYGYVEFASPNAAKEALEAKNGKYMHGGQVFLEVPKTAPHPPPRFCIHHKVGYKDYHVRVSLPTEEDETPPDSVEAVSLSKKTLFVYGLSSQTKISDITDFFNDVGEVVHVRLITNQDSRHAGYGYVEFASPTATKEALETKIGEYLHGGKIFLEVAKTAPYPPPKYCIDHKVGYEDALRQESLPTEDVTPPDFVKEAAGTEYTLFVANLSPQTKITAIIRFFNFVGKVLSVRLVVNHEGKHLSCGFVEFASP
ncbi:PREDICTED: nucleolin 2-like [Camelina sativa]|uniref:Nucleolin 2-like n=1 Tax=Camelina sativa TaxID=90675 RepID=A0ABM1QK22_CAMSA|nr:PREDICTED: nucleolin 2-like [Camelina sativa]